MDLLSRYRNITVLLLVIFAQLVLLGYQVKSNQDVRLIRVWAVTGVTPVAKVIEGARTSTVKLFGNYFNLYNLADENQRLKTDVGKLKLENQYLKSELQSADRAVALGAFQAHSPSKMLAARVIATGTGGSANSRVVFIDRGSGAEVMRGMAVITPDGIVGKVIAAYPTASQVLLITDPTFAAGVISQKHRVRGTVRGLGHSTCMVDYVQNEEQVDQGEKFYTSGDDGVFPKGLPVGTVTAARPGNPNKQVFLAPSGLAAGLEEVLIVVEGVHQVIPDPATAAAGVHLQPPPPPEEGAAPQGAAGVPVMATEADRLRSRYQKIGEAQGHKFGEGSVGSRPPDFNLSPEELAAKARAAAAAQAAKAAEAAGGGAAQQGGANPATSGAAPPAGAASKPATPKPAAPAPGAAQGTAPARVKPPASKPPAAGTTPSTTQP
ncbi:MAG TPA: rod shape-determining protein MreC [Bryobacteraceae bacterium]|nr:rod shape-determining protein MreC [Bryobacteraceae bacterium]